MQQQSYGVLFHAKFHLLWYIMLLLLLPEMANWTKFGFWNNWGIHTNPCLTIRHKSGVGQ